MTAQLPLDFAPGHRPPLARRTDPESSHRAIDQLEQSGVAEAQYRQVLALVRRHPGRTSRELAEQTGADRYMVARRAATLADRGLVWRTKVDGEDVRLWPDEQSAGGLPRYERDAV